MRDVLHDGRLILTTLWFKYCDHLHFTVEKIEVLSVAQAHTNTVGSIGIQTLTLRTVVNRWALES